MGWIKFSHFKAGVRLCILLFEPLSPLFLATIPIPSRFSLLTEWCWRSVRKYPAPFGCSTPITISRALPERSRPPFPLLVIVPGFSPAKQDRLPLSRIVCKWRQEPHPELSAPGSLHPARQSLQEIRHRRRSGYHASFRRETPLFCRRQGRREQRRNTVAQLCFGSPPVAKAPNRWSTREAFPSLGRLGVPSMNTLRGIWTSPPLRG